MRGTARSTSRRSGSAGPGYARRRSRRDAHGRVGREAVEAPEHLARAGAQRELGHRATARAAADVLDRLAERMPFPVRAISIDNGSEFMAEFETACEARGIALFVLPPRSPKLHGAVERANRTHTEEFYEVTTAEPDLTSFQAELRTWETVYDTVRPHQALGYLTPAEYLATLGIGV